MCSNRRIKGKRNIEAHVYSYTLLEGRGGQVKKNKDDGMIFVLDALAYIIANFPVSNF